MTRTELLASLTAGRADTNGIAFDDHRVIDWSTHVEPPSRPFDIGPSGDHEPTGRVFDVSAPSGDLQMALDWPEIERLHRALTLLLLERDETMEG